MTITDRTILITRPARQAAAMERSVIDAGGRCVVIPMIDITPPLSWTTCDDMIDRLQTFDAAAFSSVNAVEGFCSRVVSGGRSLQGHFSAGVLAVGQATADAAGGFGLAVLPLPAEHTGRALAASAGRRFDGRDVLNPRGDLGRNELADALIRSGARVTPVVVYRTVPPPHGVLAAAAERVKRKEFDVVSFASPSAVRNFMGAFAPAEIAQIGRWCAIAVIGSTTAAAVRSFGLEPEIVASGASNAALVESIFAHFQKS